MTPRVARLLRLVRLRERQHDVAALHLRAARGQLAQAQSAMNEAYERVRAAQLGRMAAANDGNPEEWLLARAEVEANTCIAANHHAHLACMAALVQQAVEAEIAARRERRQMEATLAPVQDEWEERLARAEGATLDEVARLQRGTRGVGSPWRINR